MNNILNDIPIVAIKPISFILVLLICFTLELNFSIFKHEYKKRLIINFSLLFFSILTIKFIFPHDLVLSFQSSLLPITLSSLPFTWGLILTVLIFDFAIYWQHRLFHIIPIFWLFHKIHHSDKAMDLSSGFRFHPVEIYLSASYKALLIFISHCYTPNHPHCLQ